MPQKLAQRIAEKSGRNLRRAILMAEACRVQQPHLTANQVNMSVLDCFKDNACSYPAIQD